jgi:hypothetical protein
VVLDLECKSTHKPLATFDLSSASQCIIIVAEAGCRIYGVSSLYLPVCSEISGHIMEY